MKILSILYLFLLLIPSCFQKVEVGDIYENQLTRNRFRVTEAHFGEYYIDSLTNKISSLSIQKKRIIEASRKLYNDNFNNLHYIFESVLKYGINLDDMNDYTDRWAFNFYNGISDQDQKVRHNILQSLPIQSYYNYSYLAREQVQTNKDFIQRCTDSLCNVLPQRDFDNEMSELQNTKSLFNTYDTYFTCSDYNEFKYKYFAPGLYLINADTLDSKLYKKIN